MEICVFSIAAIFLVSSFWIKADYKKAERFSGPSNEAACNAFGQLNNWTTWITSLQTAGIAALGFLVKDHQKDSWLLKEGFFTLLFFGASIIIASFLLCGLPAIQLRLSDTADPMNDIYQIDLHQGHKIRVGSVVRLIHTYFIAGILCFILVILTAIK
jgi:hypothetical protein